MLDTLSDEQKVVYNKLLEEHRLLKRQAKDLHNKCLSFDKEFTEYEMKHKKGISTFDDKLTTMGKLYELKNEYLTGAKRYKEVNEDISKIHTQLTENLIDPKFEDLWNSKGVSFEEREKLFDTIRKEDNVVELVKVSPIFKEFIEATNLLFE